MSLRTRGLDARTVLERNVVLFHLAVKRLAMDAEGLGRLDLVVVRADEGLLDLQGTDPRVLADPGQHRGTDLLPAMHHDPLLDDRLQLPDVPRPAVTHHGVKRLGLDADRLAVTL